MSDFKTPLTTVTTVENSVIGNTAAPKRISSKLEVNPDKTDKTNADVKDMYFDLFHRLSSDQILEENYFDEKKYCVKSNCNVNPQVSIKGKLKNNLDYWENAIGAKRVVTSAIKEGHNIPFTYTPKKLIIKINDLLPDTLVKQTNNIPRVVRPLSVAENSAGKKQLTLI